MSLVTISRRLQSSKSLLRFFHPTACAPSPFPFGCHSDKFVCSAFHRTVSIHPQPPLYSSALQSFSTLSVHDSFELIDSRIHGHGLIEPNLLELLKRAAHFPSEAEGLAFLDESGIDPNLQLVYSLIWEFREEWRLAFLAFKWGGKQGCVDEKACDLIVWVLGNHRMFNTAWVLIRDLHKSSMNTRQPMLIMIDRYAAANEPAQAIKAFHMLEKFRMTPDEEAFHALLNALCRHGNIEEAEEFMLVNKKLFPFETEAFNIILNGWCNICVDVLEAKRIWREMAKCCITPNATSYTYMISCFSKVRNLFDSVRLYDEMKKRGWVPGIGVYNSLIYVLTCENCTKEALKILDKMRDVGLQPDSTTYNSMIQPLCQAKRLQEARNILAIMAEESVSPTIETYHAFLEGTGYDGTFEVLDRMRMADLGPTKNTFLLVLSKFFKLYQPENALKIWVEMKQYDVGSDLSHYTILVEGLATCGLLTKAREYYSEMRAKGYPEDPKLWMILKEPSKDENEKGKRWARQENRGPSACKRTGRLVRGKIPHRKS